MHASVITMLGLAAAANAHVAAWTRGMYCLDGPDPTKVDLNTNTAVNPLWQKTKEDWWFQHYSGCDRAPPKNGDVLNIPANGQFTVDLATNRACSSINGQAPSEWPDCNQHPADWHGEGNPPDCLPESGGGGALHTQNETMAAGTAFAISYVSDLASVTMENLVVFTTLDHTPFRRVATYQVPDLPACPPGGCICAWLWVPTGCGQPNMYMAGYKCNVTGARSTAKKVGTAKAPTYCRDDQPKCVPGAKQMIAWQQLTGNNVDVPAGASPAYNSWNGFKNGAQTDIFVS